MIHSATFKISFYPLTCYQIRWRSNIRVPVVSYWFHHLLCLPGFTTCGVCQVLSFVFLFVDGRPDLIFFSTLIIFSKRLHRSVFTHPLFIAIVCLHDNFAMISSNWGVLGVTRHSIIPQKIIYLTFV
jgi:hypothetical protein